MRALPQLLCPGAPRVSTQSLNSVCRSPTRLRGGAATLWAPETDARGVRGAAAMQRPRQLLC